MKRNFSISVEISLAYETVLCHKNFETWCILQTLSASELHPITLIFTQIFGFRTITLGLTTRLTSIEISLRRTLALNPALATAASSENIPLASEARSIDLLHRLCNEQELQSYILL